MSEDSLQTAVIRYLNYKYPKVKYCSSIAGVHVTSKAQRAKIKRNGYMRGKNDLDIFEARGGYHALMLELKEKAYPTKAQKDWIAAMNERGYCALVTTGLDETLEVIDEYLSKERTRVI